MWACVDAELAMTFVQLSCLLLAGQGQGLKEMDMLVWLGDFNYRVDAEYGEAKGLVRRNDLSPLLSKVCTDLQADSYITYHPK